MASHLGKDGGVFLTPQARDQNNKQAWAQEAMLHYKKTHCEITRELLVVFYMQGFVKRSAAKVSKDLPQCVDPADLEQTAYFGLVDCVEKYDPERKIKFESFARLRVEGAMRDYLRKEDPVSRVARQRTKMIARSIEQFKVEFGRAPTSEELQTRLHLDDGEFEAVMRDVVVPSTLSMCSVENNDSEDSPLLCIIEQKDDTARFVEQIDLRSWLCENLCTYDKLIITLLFVENLTMFEVGCVIGYSESRVSQRIKRVLSVLKTKLTDSPETQLLMAS